jgi:hypothetical protein
MNADSGSSHTLALTISDVDQAFKAFHQHVFDVYS